MPVVEHERSVVVWDVPSAVTCGDAFTIVVGIKCIRGCRLDGWRFEIVDAAERMLATAAVGNECWPATAGLYYARVDLTAPNEPGLVRWQVVAPAVEAPMRGASTDATSPQDARPAASPNEAGADNVGPTDRDSAAIVAEHAEVRAAFNVRCVSEAEHRLTVVAVDRDDQTPIAGLRVVAHPFRATTDSAGKAELRLPRGRYRVFVSGKDYFPFRCDGEMKEDVTLRAEMTPDLPLTDAEQWS